MGIAAGLHLHRAERRMQMRLLLLFAVASCLVLHADAMMPEGSQVLKLADTMAVESQHNAKAVPVAQSQGEGMAITQASIQTRSATVALNMCNDSLRRLRTETSLQKHAATVALHQCSKEVEERKRNLASHGKLPKQEPLEDYDRLGETEEAEAPTGDFKYDLTVAASQDDKAGTIEPLQHKQGQQLALTRVQLQMRSASIALNMCKKKLKRIKSSQGLSARAAQVAISGCNRKNNGLRIAEETTLPTQADLGESIDPVEASEPVDCKFLANQIQAKMVEKLQLKKILAETAQRENKTDVEAGATEGVCSDMNQEYKLSPSHQCCNVNSGTNSGCPFVAVRGQGQAESIRCHQFRARGPSTKCHYAKATYDKHKKKYVGNETIQNQAHTNFVRCTTFEIKQNLQTIERLAHVGFTAANGVSSGQEEEVWKPWGMDKSPFDDDVDENPIPNPIPPEDPDMGESIDKDAILHDLGTNSVQIENLAAPVSNPANANADQWTKKDGQRTSIAVHVLAEKTQECTLCGEEKNATEQCYRGQRAICKVKKVIKCDKICFLVGQVGLESRGELAWTQGFTAQECPVLQKMKDSSTLSTQNQTLKNKAQNQTSEEFLRITTDSILLKNQGLDIQPVTLEKVMDTLPNFTNTDDKLELLAAMYNSEDKNLQQCCFPACRIPKQVMAGKFYRADNAWYWYNRDSPLSRSAPLEFAYSF